MELNIDNSLSAAVDESIRILMELLSIPALGPENGGEGEAEKAARLEELLAATGLFPAPRHYDVPDPRVSSNLRPNLVYRFDPPDNAAIPAAGRLWILLHLDVVPAGDPADWETPPFEPAVRNGAVYGRGSEDNGGGIAAALAALIACLRGGNRFPRPVGLVFVADEELSSRCGIIHLLSQQGLFAAGDSFLVPDGGSHDGLEIEVAEKGLLWLRGEIRGNQGHAARPDKSLNASVAAARLLLSLNGMDERFSSRNPLFEPPVSTFVPTRRELPDLGVNVVPGWENLYLDCRVLPGCVLDDVLDEARRRAVSIADATGCSISINVIDRTEATTTDSNHPLPLALASVLRERDRGEPRFVGAGGSTVAAYLRQAGFPALVWSTTNGTAHQANEHFPLKAIRSDAEVLIRLFKELR